MKRVLLEPAFILHRRPYRETSYLLELFSLNHGRISAVAKGVRKVRSSLCGILEPFVPLLVSWSGKGELMALSAAELNGEIISLEKESLFAGFYLNELIYILLEKWDPHPALFHLYKDTLYSLQIKGVDERVLRSFEKQLLVELGYGLFSQSALHLNKAISPDQYYRFIPEQGFVLEEIISSHPRDVNSPLFLGSHLLNIAQENWEEKESLREAKRLMRVVLFPLLGSRSIYSRQLFIQNEVKHEE
jgi:DNA repair protein RecO (recombination protein O)